MGAGLHHAGDQEDLVVRGQAKEDCHDEHQDRAHQWARREVEQVRAHTVDEEQGQHAQGRADAQHVHDHSLRRDDQRSEDQGHEHEADHPDVEHHPRQLVEECLDGFLLHGRGSGDQHLGALGIQVLQLLDDALVVIAVGDAGGQHRRVVLRRLRDAERTSQPGDVVGLPVDLGHRLLIALNDELDRVGAEGRELLVEVILRHTSGLVRRQVGLVDSAELDASHRGGQAQQQRDQQEGHGLGVAHREGRDATPDGVDLLVAGAGLVLAHRPLIDVVTQHAEDARQHHHGEQRSQADRAHRAEGHGLQEGLREDQQAGERDGHHRRGEDHRLAGRRGGVSHRGGNVAALGELLAEAGDHEQAVVDRQAQAQQGDDGDREDVDLRGRRKQ